MTGRSSIAEAGLMVRDARPCRAPHHEGLTACRIGRPHPEEAPTGPRKARPDDKLRAVSKDGPLQDCRHAFAFSRHDLPELLLSFRPRNQKRAQGRPVAHRTHGPRATKSTRQNHRYRRIIRPSLRNGFNGVLRALPGDHAWLPPSPVRRESVFTTLAPALERQNHTTSPSAQTPFVRAIIALGDVRPSHPIPNVRDDREPPLYGERDKRKEATDLGVRSIAADRDRLARRAKSAYRPCDSGTRGSAKPKVARQKSRAKSIPGPSRSLSSGSRDRWRCRGMVEQKQAFS